jgi:hypothetical protein
MNYQDESKVIELANSRPWILAGNPRNADGVARASELSESYKQLGLVREQPDNVESIHAGAIRLGRAATAED